MPSVVLLLPLVSKLLWTVERLLVKSFSLVPPQKVVVYIYAYLAADVDNVASVELSIGKIVLVSKGAFQENVDVCLMLHPA